jgi:hypothetical protein
MELTREQIHQAAKVYLRANAPATLLLHHEEDIVNMATSIYCTKHNISYSGGSFAQAVANNDLYAAVAKADDLNVGILPLYVKFLHNFSPYNLV